MQANLAVVVRAAVRANGWCPRWLREPRRAIGAASFSAATTDGCHVLAILANGDSALPSCGAPRWNRIRARFPSGAPHVRPCWRSRAASSGPSTRIHDCFVTAPWLRRRCSRRRLDARRRSLHRAERPLSSITSRCRSRSAPKPRSPSLGLIAIPLLLNNGRPARCWFLRPGAEKHHLSLARHAFATSSVQTVDRSALPIHHKPVIQAARGGPTPLYFAAYVPLHSPSRNFCFASHRGAKRGGNRRRSRR